MALKDEMLERALNKLAEGGDAQKVMTELANKLTNRLIHQPTRSMSAASHQGETQKLAVISEALGVLGND